MPAISKVIWLLLVFTDTCDSGRRFFFADLFAIRVAIKQCGLPSLPPVHIIVDQTWVVRVIGSPDNRLIWRGGSGDTYLRAGVTINYDCNGHLVGIYRIQTIRPIQS